MISLKNLLEASQYVERHGVDPAPLQPHLHERLKIVEQLQAAGGSMTARRLFNIRRWRKEPIRWCIAMNQLVANGIVRLTGSGRRGDPVVVRLVNHPDDKNGAQSSGQGVECIQNVAEA